MVTSARTRRHTLQLRTPGHLYFPVLHYVFPHKHQHDFLPLGDDAEILPCTQHFVGALNYLCQLHWTWAADSECVVRPLSANDIYSRSAFPGNLSESASAFAPGAPVFADVDATGGIKPSMGMAKRALPERPIRIGSAT